MKLIYFLLIVAITSCTSKYAGYEEQSSGLYFKLMSIEEDSRRILPGDFVQLKYTFTDYKKDTIASNRILFEVHSNQEQGGLLEALTLLNVKEVGKFIFPVSTLKNEVAGKLIVQGFADTMMLFSELKIDKLYTRSEFETAQEKFVDWVRQIDTTDFDVFKENQLLDEYEKQTGLIFEKTPSGLRYFKITKGNGQEVKFGKRVEIKYSGYFLDGTIFNSTKNLENKVQDFYIGQEMQVLKGIDEVLLHMSEGDEMQVLLPSWLAFGNDGSSTGVVVGKTPVMFRIEVKRVN